jgi:beta-phosphoglucomutase-like phosphatase (HAD superfamily)
VTISALIFDFDGLLVDTESAVLLAWQEMFRERGTELLLEVWHTVIGMQHTTTAMLKLLEEHGSSRTPCAVNFARGSTNWSPRRDPGLTSTSTSTTPPLRASKWPSPRARPATG